MIRRQGQVQRIPRGVCRHDPVPQVGLHDLRNGGFDRQQRQSAKEREPLGAVFGGPLASSSRTAGLVSNS